MVGALTPRDFVAIAEAYAREAAADQQGRRFCKWARLAAVRHLRDMERASQDPDWPYQFDAWHAADVCEFAERLPHVEGRWNTATITLEPAQIFWLTSLFGWRRRTDGMRRFSVAYIEVARKNAKSTLAAIVSLYCLTCEGENGPQILIAATTGEQANKVFSPAKRMVERTTALREAFLVQAFVRSISCGGNGGFIQPINAKASTQDGWNPHAAVLDELHAHKDRGLYDVVRSAFGARKNPLLLQITTAGHNHEGVCYEQRTLLTKILEGVVTADHYWGVIYTLDEGDDPFDAGVWIKANPLLGVSIQLEEMQGYAIEARNSNEAALRVQDQAGQSLAYRPRRPHPDRTVAQVRWPGRSGCPGRRALLGRPGPGGNDGHVCVSPGVARRRPRADLGTLLSSGRRSGAAIGKVVGALSHMAAKRPFAPHRGRRGRLCGDRARHRRGA